VGKQTSEQTYIYRRLDTNELVEMPFSAVLEQDALGYITLPDGVQAKRCVWLENVPVPQAKAVHTGMDRHDLTFSLGFSKKQLPEMMEAAKRDGLRGVEFYPDPQNANMVGIRCGSEAEKNAYIKHRGKNIEGGLINRTGRLGGKLGKEDIEMAQKLVRERYGTEGAGAEALSAREDSQS
jgi:hypothetical protein